MMKIEHEIEERVNIETQAWDDKNVEVLLSLFHPDMVWPWPSTAHSHNPADWIITQGRFNYDRWKTGWQDLFVKYTLVHNIRKIAKIKVSEEGDGAFAVVDIDTLWRDSSGEGLHWKGRVCKVYSKVAEEWKITMHTGVLEY